ncbi:MAG: hypothetical protein RL272_728 [Candidatus Parcubacteria bacterium]|jgi:glucokinase
MRIRASFLMPNRTIIGLDVGGTKIRAGVVSSRGRLIISEKIPTEGSRGKAVVLENIVKSVRSVWQKDVKAIGVGMAGIVDHGVGVYRQGPNLPAAFKNIPIAAILRRRFRVPVKVDNDVHCFTLAEAKFGAAKRFSSVVGLTLGTGIGGGIVIGGRLYRGRDNAAGEIGHMTVSSAFPATCGCGRKGHFESYGSGSAMRKIHRAIAHSDLEPLAVERAAEHGNARAKKTLRIMADGLADGFANIIHVLNPEIIVVGGSIAAVDGLWKPAVAAVRDRVVYPALRTTPIVRAELGSDANVIGAALITEEM